MSAPLAIRVLGPLEVERAGTVHAIGSPMQRRLMTALLIARGETVSTDRLVEALWGSDPPASARNSLQTYVARLRDGCGDRDLILTAPHGYALDTSRIRVDAWDFRDRVDRARRLLDDDPATAATVLSEALDAWRGDAYGEFADEFAREAAAQLFDLRVEAVESLALAHLRTGASTAALAALDGSPGTSALRETTVLLRARALASAGRLPEALTAVRAYRERLADELGLDASRAVDDLEQRLLRGELALPGTMPVAPPGAVAEGVWAPVGVPRLATETVGRDEDHARVTTALADASLVTLVGPGGVGKTRLAAVVGHEAGGAAWIDLAPVRSAEDVAPALADGLGLAVPAGTGVARAVVDRLSVSGGIVIVDNCEHVLDPVADLIEQVLARSRQVRILATSRERLDVAGEVVVPITPLRVPARHAASRSEPAVRLFLDRLEEAGGEAIDPADAADVVAAVDGLPLAIELAAARAASLPVADLLVRLRERLDVLTGTRRRHGDRHLTLDRVITWSHDLLGPRGQVLFRRSSVFSATFRLQDAERICGDAELPREVVATELARLVDASMVTRSDDGRFRLLEPLRLYAAGRLAGSDDEAAVHERQREAALELTARADAAVSGPGESGIVAEVELALPDLRAVQARALAHGDLATVARMAAQLYRFAYLRARSDVLRWGAALAGDEGRAVPDEDRARALAAAASGSWLAGDLDRAVELVARARPLAGDLWSQVTTSEVAGDVSLAVGDIDAAVAAFTENRTYAEELGHVGLVAQAEAGLAFACLQRGDSDLAVDLARKAVRRASESRAPSVRALAEYTLGEALADDPDAALEAFARAQRIAVDGRSRFHEGIVRTADVALRGRHGPPDEALRRYRQAVELWRDSGADGLLLTTFRNLVVLLVRTGADAAALELYAAVERLTDRQSYGDEARRLDAATAAARERLGREAAARAASAGEPVTDLRGAADLALRAIADVQREPHLVGGAG